MSPFDPHSLPAPPPEIAPRLIDTHAHPTDTGDAVAHEGELGLGVVCAMASKEADQEAVEKLGEEWREGSEGKNWRIVPFFGYHPWWCHTISLSDNPPSPEEHYSSLLLPPSSHPKHAQLQSQLSQLLPYLPPPTPLPSLLSLLRQRFSNPRAHLGEVGLDRAFKLPFPREVEADTRLTGLTTPLEHQRAVLVRQIEVLMDVLPEQGVTRAISVHSVGAKAATAEVLEECQKRWCERWLRDVKVSMHSCGLGLESIKDIAKKHPNVFFGFSHCINSRSPSLLHRSILASPAHRLLPESDYPSLPLIPSLVFHIYHEIASVRSWTLDETLVRLEENWQVFSGQKEDLEVRKWVERQEVGKAGGNRRDRRAALKSGRGNVEECESESGSDGEADGQKEN